VTFKDLGAQVSWRTVFLVEYAGPLIIFPVVYYLSLSDTDVKLPVQHWAMLMIFVHYMKRELETCFVHVFSRSTMPIKRIFINSAHYWILCGLAISIELYFYWDG